MSTKLERSSDQGPYIARRSADPILWHPWSVEQFERARVEDKLIFVHLGRHNHSGSASLDKELTSDPKLVRLLNERFVSLIVDIDEQPAVQSVAASIMLALGRAPALSTQLLLTPQGKPFFATGPLPVQSHEGRPGLLALLEQSLKLKQSSAEEFQKQADALYVEVKQRCALPEAGGSLGDSVLRAAFLGLGRNFDPAFYGFGKAPKFAQVPALKFLLNYARRRQHREAQTMALLSLGAMSTGGFYDQLAGGFFHQSRDRRFLLPHFEKHLADNAELGGLFLSAFRLTSHAPMRRVAIETFDMMVSDFAAPEGGFFLRLSAEDAEGSHYLWTRRQLKQTLGEPAATHFAHFFGVRELAEGEKPASPSALRSLAAVSKELGIAEAELTISLESSREKLLQQRAKRGRVLIDDRLVTSENAVTISELSRASSFLSDERYLALSIRTADRFWAARVESGLLPHRLDQSEAGGLDDQVYFLQALLSLHQTTFSTDYLDRAVVLAALIIDHFGHRIDSSAAAPPAISLTLQAKNSADNSNRGVFDLRPGPQGDTAREQVTGVLSRILYQLAYLTGNRALLEQAKQLLAPFSTYLRRSPQGACGLVEALDWLLEPPILLILPKDPSARQEILLEAWKHEGLHLLMLPDRAASLSDLDCPTGSLSSARDLEDQLPELLARVQALRVSELLRRTHPGSAQPEATQLLLDRQGVIVRRRSDLTTAQVSRIGLGSYRIGLDKSAHAEAVREALTSGVNVIDSSPSFALGDSQRVIGETLDDLIASGTVLRQEIYVMTKVGVAVGQQAEELEAARQMKTAAPATVPLRSTTRGDEGGVSLAHGAFSLDPDFIEKEITLSLARLGLDHLDACLINSPEHLLLAGFEADAFAHALQAAFTHLEREVARGRIGCYGVVSSKLRATAPAPEERLAPGTFVLEDLLTLAERAAGGISHFNVVEAPVNLVEDGAIESAESSLFSYAKAKGLTTIACRPLSAVSEGALLRLTDVPKSPDGARAEDLSSAKYRVISLEAEFETTLAVQLRLTKRIGQEQVLPFSGPIGTTLAELATRQQFEQAETTLVTPRLRSLLAQLDQAFSGQSAYQTWKTKYIKAVAAYLACVREFCSNKNRTLLHALEERIKSSGRLSDPETWLAQPWSVRAVTPLIDHPDVDVVLVGMRSKDQVKPMVALLR